MQTIILLYYITCIFCRS